MRDFLKDDIKSLVPVHLRLCFSDDFDDFFGIVGHVDEVHCFGEDCAVGDEGFFDEGSHGFPEVFAHHDDRELFDFAGLDEHGRLEDFVEGAEPAGHDDEGVGVFDEHDLANEEVFEINEEIEEWVGMLFVRELDVAPD